MSLSYCSSCAAEAKQWNTYLKEDEWWFNVGYEKWRKGEL